MTVVSLFAGCGGSSLGYKLAGYQCRLAVERDNNAAACYRLNFPDTTLYHGDVCALTELNALKMSSLKPGELDVLDGSPPCQGFSTAGKREMSDSRNLLFQEYIRLLKVFQPRALIMENVSGMVKGKMKLIFVEILKELKAAGYRVSCRLMNAMFFGVPQNRQRVIFIGTRNDLAIDPSHPLAETRFPRGCVRLDARAAKYSSVRYGDQIVKEGQVVPTITKIGRLFWNTKEELGPLSYAAAASFPPEFKFVGSLSHCKARIGNSVPPLFMKAMAIHMGTLL